MTLTALKSLTWPASHTIETAMWNVRVSACHSTTTHLQTKAVLRSSTSSAAPHAQVIRMRECKSGNHTAACSKHRSQSSATGSAQAAPLFSPLAGASKSSCPATAAAGCDWTRSISARTRTRTRPHLYTRPQHPPPAAPSLAEMHMQRQR